MAREKELREDVLHEKLIHSEQMNYTVIQCCRAQGGTYSSLMRSLWTLDFTVRDWMQMEKWYALVNCDLEKTLEVCSMVHFQYWNSDPLLQCLLLGEPFLPASASLLQYWSLLSRMLFCCHFHDSKPIPASGGVRIVSKITSYPSSVGFLYLHQKLLFGLCRL